MVTMATATYGATHAAVASMSLRPNQAIQQPANEEQYISTFFCRALYDYNTTDTSSLSFRKNDIIEVLTQLETGWWDGLLGDERGWFPSNYVAVISDEEAEVAINGPEMTASQPPSLADDSTVDMAHSMSRSVSQSDHDAEWLNSDAEYSHPIPQTNGYTNGVNGKSTQHNDFWVPQVSHDGRIFYVNTQTGQHSRDLPQEPEEDAEADFGGLANQGPSRLAMGLRSEPVALNGMIQDPSAVAGFGIPRRSRTPEPWIRRLADDGLSYYYVNKHDGLVSWTRPESNPLAPREAPDGPASSGFLSRNDSFSSRGAPMSATRSQSASSVPRSRERSDSNADGYSINSDDSDIFPTQRARSRSSTNPPKQPDDSTTDQQRDQQAKPTPPEQHAKALQQVLAPPGPESPVDLSNHVREAITATMDYLRSALSPRRPEQFEEVDKRVLEVVSSVRNLLYVTATPSGHIPSHLYPRDSRDIRPPSGQSLQSHLKAAQRKVAGTLSKLVLSALAMQYDPALSSSDRPNRIESDITDLERAVVAFVTEVHYFQEQNPLPARQHRPSTKRLHGVFSTANIGLGLPGAGAAASWKGFGYIPLDESAQSSLQKFSSSQVTELKIALRALEDRLNAMTTLLQRLDYDSSSERLRRECQLVTAHLSSIAEFVSNIDIARHVDVDGIRLESRQSLVQAQYMKTVDKARLLVRTLEAALQSLYDDGMSLLIAVQSRVHSDPNQGSHTSQQDLIDALSASIVSNTSISVQSLEALLGIGFDQADVSQSDHADAIEWQKSRPVDVPDEEVVDMEMAFGRPGTRVANPMDIAPMDIAQASSSMYYESGQSSQTSLDMSGRSRSDSVAESTSTPAWSTEPSESGTLVMQPSLQEPSVEDLVDVEDELASSSKSPPRGIAAARKIATIFGEDPPPHIINKFIADTKPWYLRLNYDQSELLMDVDGAVRAGTPAGFVERLTAHEAGDPTFNQNFLLTFKSFMTVDELFDLLVRRFWIEAPSGLGPADYEEWIKLKQNIIRMRVLNTFKTMVTDDGILEKEDSYILARMKEFASQDEVIKYTAAKQLIIRIERAQRGEDPPIPIRPVPAAPPAPILPRNTKKMKLLEVDPLELARQLTLMEAAMYKKIRPMECLLRSRETKPGRTSDNFSSIIQLSNRIANWVADSVLEKEESRRRAAIVKHFISIADRCRAMQNYSTMTAIVSGLATPPIRRLKRTWEQVNARFMTQLELCESTIDTTRNFNKYRSTLARIDPPCVPFIGVYLTTLTFINDGAEDKLDGNMINFRKRQKAAEVIHDIKRWQSKPYIYQSVSSVLSYLEECFGKYSDGVDYADQFWNLSLEREPREREDEKMARLLQESGFL